MDEFRLWSTIFMPVASESNESCPLRAGRDGKIEPVRYVDPTTICTAMLACIDSSKGLT